MEYLYNKFDQNHRKVLNLKHVKWRTGTTSNINIIHTNNVQTIVSGTVPCGLTTYQFFIKVWYSRNRIFLHQDIFFQQINSTSWWQQFKYGTYCYNRIFGMINMICTDNFWTPINSHLHCKMVMYDPLEIQSLAPENTTEWTQITKNQKLHYNNIIFQKVAAIFILFTIYLPVLSLLRLNNL